MRFDETTNNNRYSGPRDRSLRVSDRDRDQVAETLRREHLAGRLDSTEFNERVEKCFAAKTYADLDQLIADLPSERSAPPPWGRLAWRPFPFFPFVPVIVIAVVIAGGRHHIWLAIPIFLLFLFLARLVLWRSYGRRRNFWGCGVGRLSSRPGASS